MTLNLTPITPAIGAIVDNIDISTDLSADQQNAIYQALMRHQVIFLPNQRCSPEQHLAFAAGFGEPQPPHPVYPHVEGQPQIVKLHNGPENPPDTDGWHTDLTFLPRPPFASFLLAKRVPACGGDTLWTSLTSAYDALPKGIKSELSDKQAVHDMGDFRNNFSNADNSPKQLIEAHQRFGSAIHPIIQRHPVTGKKIIYVNEGFTQHIVGLRASESNQLLQFLFRHINQPEFQMRWHWQADTLAIWDNRCTWHYATADYLPHERIMHRVTLTNDRRAPSI